MIVLRVRDMWRIHMKKQRMNCCIQPNYGRRSDIAIMLYRVKKSLVWDADQRIGADIRL